ncbi:MAG: PorT family protein [candidate division Zixibacteria bacterium]|nr:PorT family protein [candidate division Zixibacteria bacterium]
MKTLFLTLGLIAMLALGAAAQDEATTGIVGKGIKAGINMANITGDDVDDLDMKLGFGFGGFLVYAVSPQLVIQPEVLYMMKGAQFDDEDGETWKIKVDYLEIPVLVKFKFPTEGNFKPCLFAGPALGILMSAKVEDEDIKDDLKSIDFGLAFGGGFGLVMGEGMLTFDARYTLGMSNVNDWDVEEGETLPDNKNANISIMLGYSF